MSPLFMCVVLMVAVVQSASIVCRNRYVAVDYVGYHRVPTNCASKTPSDCPRSWKSGVPEGLAKATPLIYPEFITCHEGLASCGYVPISSRNGEVLGNSGVTIGAGVDLGSKSRSYPGFNALASSLVDKLEPYFGLQKNLAACAAIEQPLLLSTSEATLLTNAVKEHIADNVENRYDEDRAIKALAFSSLPRGIRTAIVSVWFQFGSPDAYPNFWNFVKKNDWEKAVEELRNFYEYPATQQMGDLKRRNDEADIIEATLLKCNRSIDAVFLLDESGSVSYFDFAASLGFVKNLIKSFPDEKLRDNGTRFGLSTFSGGYTARFYLSAYTSQSEYETAINNVGKKGGGTSLGYALGWVLADQFIEERGLRSESEGVPRVLIVLTDGRSSDAVQEPAQLVRDENIVIYAIGIGNYDETQLKNVASSDSHVYTLSQFSELATFIATLTAATCNEPQPVSLNKTIQATTAKDEYQYFSYTVEKDSNLELEVNDLSGETILYASRNNPNPYKYDNDISFETSSQTNKVIVISPKGPGDINITTDSSDVGQIYISVSASTENAEFAMIGNTCDPLNCTEGTNEIKLTTSPPDLFNATLSAKSAPGLFNSCRPVPFIFALFSMSYLYF